VARQLAISRVELSSSHNLEVLEFCKILIFKNDIILINISSVGSN
jgi:hypothetical protein